MAQLASALQVLGLRQVHLIDPARYPSFTLIRQAWGSLLLGLEALRLMVPEVRVLQRPTHQARGSTSG